MIVILLAAGASLLAEPRVIETLNGDDYERLGISGNVIERPAGVSDGDFAIQVMEAEGLIPWHGEPMIFPPGEAAMGTAAIVAANGHEINVKYVAGDSSRPGHICRLRFQPGVGAHPARWNAYRWCAAAFGLSLPDPLPPPIALVEEAWPRASGDFDRDGAEDRAYIRSLRGAHELVVERGAGGLVVVQDVGVPATLYVEVLAPGTYQTACGKGLGPRGAPCPLPSVTLDAPTLQFGVREASQAVALWDGRGFEVVWLSD